MIRSPRILWVLPGPLAGLRMIFAKRQLRALVMSAADVHSTHLSDWQSSSALFRNLQRLRAAVRNINPDIIHAQYGSWLAAMCGLITAKPLIVTYRGSDLYPAASSGRLRGYIGCFLSQLAALRATEIVCVSRSLRDRLWWRRCRATIIPSPVDLDEFFPTPRDEARSALGWGTEPTVLFNAGQDPVTKDLKLAQQAIAIAGKLIGPIKFSVLNGTVRPDAVGLRLNAADCLLVTSRYEGSPNIVKEALACNLPVVSTDVGDVAERLQSVFPSIIAQRDAAAIGQAVALVLSLNRRSNGRNTTAAFSVLQTTERLRRLYESATDPRRRSHGSEVGWDPGANDTPVCASVVRPRIIYLTAVMPFGEGTEVFHPGIERTRARRHRADNCPRDVPRWTVAPEVGHLCWANVQAKSLCSSVLLWATVGTIRRPFRVCRCLLMLFSSMTCPCFRISPYCRKRSGSPGLSGRLEPPICTPSGPAPRRPWR